MIAAGLLGRLQRRRLPRGARGRRVARSGRAAIGGRAGARPRRSLPRLRVRTVAILLAVALLLGGGWMWLRDSSLVAVNRVTVTGVGGPDAPQIRRALLAAAENMTTLDVRMGQLKNAVAPYPVVKDLRVSTQFPHGMRIHVIEHVPVGAISVDGRTIPVAGNGTLLHDVAAPASLPTIPLRVAPGGVRLTEPDSLHAVALLAAAPYRMLGKVSEVTTVASHGLVAQLRNGPSIYFGDSDRLAAKWLAAAAVLADPGSAGALYIDVTDPDHPAAGAGSSSTDASATGTPSSSAVTSTATSATGTPSSTADTSTATVPSATSPTGP